MVYETTYLTLIVKYMIYVITIVHFQAIIISNQYVKSM